MDLVLKLREIRHLRGLSQKDVARLSGVGEKTISSFETGQRIGSLKLSQLKRLLAVYGLTEADFFGCSVERQIAPWELDEDESAAAALVEELRTLPKHVQKAMVSRFKLMLEGASEVHQLRDNRPTHPNHDRDRNRRGPKPAYVRGHPEWEQMAGRN